MTLDLLATLAVVEDDVAAVVERYMTDPCGGMVGFGEGYRIDSASGRGTASTRPRRSLGIHSRGC